MPDLIPNSTPDSIKLADLPRNLRGAVKKFRQEKPNNPDNKPIIVSLDCGVVLVNETATHYILLTGPYRAFLWGIQMELVNEEYYVSKDK